jgi:hypothetical protein
MEIIIILRILRRRLRDSELRIWYTRGQIGMLKLSVWMDSEAPSTGVHLELRERLCLLFLYLHRLEMYWDWELRLRLRIQVTKIKRSSFICTYTKVHKWCMHVWVVCWGDGPQQQHWFLSFIIYQYHKSHSHYSATLPCFLLEHILFYLLGTSYLLARLCLSLFLIKIKDTSFLF